MYTWRGGIVWWRSFELQSVTSENLLICLKIWKQRKRRSQYMYYHGHGQSALRFAASAYLVLGYYSFFVKA
jgi:hypothetical protein